MTDLYFGCSGFPSWKNLIYPVFAKWSENDNPNSRRFERLMSASRLGRKRDDDTIGDGMVLLRLKPKVPNGLST